MAVPFDEWLRLIETEYLDSFIADGGAAVKLLVAPEYDEVSVTLAGLAASALERGYLLAWVDASQTKVQLVEQLFHAVARQIDWSEALERWMRERFVENGYALPEGVPLTALDALASANDTSRPQLLAEVRRWIKNTLGADGNLCKELRTALNHLSNVQHPYTVALLGDGKIGEGFLAVRVNLQQKDFPWVVAVAKGLC